MHYFQNLLKFVPANNHSPKVCHMGLQWCNRWWLAICFTALQIFDQRRQKLIHPPMNNSPPVDLKVLIFADRANFTWQGQPGLIKRGKNTCMCKNLCVKDSWAGVYFEDNNTEYTECALKGHQRTPYIHIFLRAKHTL